MERMHQVALGSRLYSCFFFNKLFQFRLSVLHTKPLSRQITLDPGGIFILTVIWVPLLLPVNFLKWSLDFGFERVS